MRELSLFVDRSQHSDCVYLQSSSYDVIWTNTLAELLDRFQYHFKENRILFGAEPYCWPNKELASDYPLVEFGKRYFIFQSCELLRSRYSR